jgi:anti-sigma-K factor RskA
MSDVRLGPPDEGGHGDAAAYLLGALSAAGRARFESHAAACAACLRELAELQPVADRLALSVPQRTPPPDLSVRLLARAREISAVLPAPVPPPVVGPLVAPGAPARRGVWQLVERASGWLAAAALLIALLAGGYALLEQQEFQRTAATAAQLMETLAIMYQPGMVARTLTGGEGAPQAKGRLFLTMDGQQAVLMAYDLPRLPRGEAYQVWLSNPDEQRRVSGGLFTVDDRGRGHAIVRSPEAFERFRQCGVTREPARGSPKPTGQRVLVGSI